MSLGLDLLVADDCGLSERDSDVFADKVPPDFLAWLKTAHTEEGPFPDWPYITDTARSLAAGRDTVILKRRQILASWMLAAYAHWTAAYHAASHVAIISAGQREADELSRKIGYLCDTDTALGAQDGRGGAKQGMRVRRYASGSQIVVLPSTAHAGIGYTLRLAILDEFSAHPHDRANLAAIRPAVADGQLIICSTTHPGIGAAGAFYEAWEAAASVSKTASGPHALFLGQDVRPDQGADWIEAQRLRYSEEEFASYYPTTPEEAFSAPSGLVYRFTEANLGHSRGSCRDTGRCGEPHVGRWLDCVYRVVGVDPGGNDPTAVVPVGILPRAEGPAHTLRLDLELARFHVYGHLYRRGAVGAQDVHEYLLRLRDAGGVDAVFVDGSQTALIATLQGMGWPAFPAPKARGDGIGHVGRLVETGALTVSPECDKLIREFRTYWWDERRDTDRSIDPFATRTPRAEHHADALDALRYAVMGYLFAMPGPAVRPVSFLSREAPLRPEPFYKVGVSPAR